MAVTATVFLECDECGTDTQADLDPNQTPEDIIDREDWSLTGTLLDRLLCPTCADEQED